MNLMFSLSLGLAVATSVFPAFAQESFTPINLAGTVIADNKIGLSYGLEVASLKSLRARCNLARRLMDKC